MFRSERLDFTRPALRSAAEGRLVRLCATRATLNYFGQGGLLLTDPGAVESPFYQLGKQIVLRDRAVTLGGGKRDKKPFEAVSSEFVAIGQSTVRGAALRTSAFSRAIMCFTSGQQDGDKAHRRMVGILSLGDVSNSAPDDLLSECIKSVSAHH